MYNGGQGRDESGCDMRARRPLVARPEMVISVGWADRRQHDYGAWFKEGAPAVVGSTLRAVPATIPDPFLNNADYGSTVYTPV